MYFASLISSLFSVKLLFLIIVSFIILLMNKFKKQRNVAPGPKDLSATLKIFKPFAFKYFYELTKQYGPLVELSLFGKPFIILGNYDAIREAFITNGEFFVDRPKASVFNEYSKHKGILFASGVRWYDQKKFVVGHLLRSGVQEAYDKIILEEAKMIIKEIDKKNGKSFDPKDLFVQLTTNVTMRMACSERCDYDNINHNLQETIYNIMYQFRMSNPVNFFPPLKYFLKSYKKYQQNLKDLREYFMNIVKEHEDSFDENNLRDYVDDFLFKMYEDERNGETETTFTKDQLIVVLTDFLIGGSLSCSFTLLYGILFLLHHPNILTKLQNEILDVIGSSRQPHMTDYDNCPFTHATILEIQRLANISPYAAARIAKGDIKIMGYDIPNKAFVIPNLYYCHLDPDYWNDPFKFNPERFFEPNGEIIEHVKSFRPFSTGYRQCPAEPLAKSENFLVLTSFLQHYNLKAVRAKLPRMDGIIEACSLCPLPFELSFTLRE